MINQNQIQQELARLNGEVTKLREHIMQIRPHLFDNTQASGGGTSAHETVTLTLNSGTGGNVTTAANFTYNFTSADNIAHANVSPAHQRLNAAKKGTIGTWDNVQLKLVWTDEIPDAGGCT